MNKQTLEGMYGYFRMVLGVSRKVIDQFPEDKLNFKPTDAQRTVSEIVVHMYSFLLASMKTVQAGKFVGPQEPAIADKGELLAFMDKSVEEAYQIFGQLTDEQLQPIIEAYGDKFSAWQFLTFAYDEHWHHRGALTVYLRLCGVEPLMIYDY
jgi:uncharacterized damage-inducible protein DinB